MRVVLAGGGTAGHVEPALALADALRRIDPAVEVTALGTARGLETRLVPARGYSLELIPAVPLPRRVGAGVLAVPTRLAAAVRAAGRVLDRTRADVVVGFGGYVALPAYLAARRRRIPIVVHEANARPGLANRIGARFAQSVAVASPEVSLPRAVHVGIPLRRSVATLDRTATRPAARAEFGLDADAPTLLVFGGSQGALRLNDAVVGAAAALADAGVQVLHSTGAAHLDRVRAVIDAVLPAHNRFLPFVTVPYLDRMDLAYAAADLAVSRAGAITCAEVAAVGLPTCFVPLPHGNGEQRLNALPLLQAGAALVIDDALMSADRLAGLVLPLLADGAKLAAMGTAAATVGRRDADIVLAEMVREAATRPSAGPAAPGPLGPAE